MLVELMRRIRRKEKRIAVSSLLGASLALIALAACQGVPIPVEVTRVVEAEVTKVVEVEVTRVVEVTPAPPPPAEPVAADVDRIGFPSDYKETFQIYYEFDRPDNRSARVIYANDLAASVTQADLDTFSVESGKPFPYGSELIMEVYRTQRTEDGSVVLDENGRYVRDELFGLFVMRKDPGFGAKYGTQRNGEWEYAAYRPDGSTLTPPENTGACAACHVEASAGRDWVFGADRHFAAMAEATAGTPAENEIILSDYMFSSSTITVTVGSEVKWTNDDVIFHTVTARDWSFGSGMLRPNASYTYKFETAGTFEYLCSIHPSMVGTVVVVEP